MSSARTRFDVSRPGSTPASQTSRPTITSHQQIDNDPMLQTSQNPAAASAETPKKRRTVNIAPLSQSVEPGTAAATEPPLDQSVAASDNSTGHEIDSLEPKPLAESDDVSSAAIQALVDAKTYNLPISAAPTTQLLRLVVAVVVVVVALGLAAAVLFL